MKTFNEQQTRQYYNEDDELYRSFWDRNGNCHWGFFKNDKESFGKAMMETNRRMLKLSGIQNTSKVLELGCGNGSNAFFVHNKTKAHIAGIDLSDTRIQKAQLKLSKMSKVAQGSMSFIQGTATNLPFKNQSFSHVWTQATIYHIHDKQKALEEIARVLKSGGILILDDLIKPNKKISKVAEKVVYERLLFNTDYDLVSYQQALKNLGFRILYAEDLSRHYGLSYIKLAGILQQKINKGENKNFHKRYKDLVHAYRKTWDVMNEGSIGWAMIMAIKQ